MTTPAISPGDVFRLVCRFSQVTKPKIMILLKTKPCEFFIINSSINAFISSRPELLGCQIDIPYLDHRAFLTHDSVADCANVVDTSAVISEKAIVFGQLIDHRVGRIADYVIGEIIHSLNEHNQTIKTKLKNEIIASLTATQQP